MNITDALSELRSNTRDFLSNNRLKIAGGSENGIATFYFGYKDDRFENYFKFEKDSGCMIKKAGSDGLGYRALRAHNIRMTPKTEDFGLDEIPGYRLDNTGPDLMITGQLNACSFVVMEDRLNGGYLVAHLQPGGSRPQGAELRNVVRDTGAFGANGNVSVVYGLGDYPNFASIIGVRDGANWHIYGQSLAGSYADPIIVGVTQLV